MIQEELLNIARTTTWKNRAEALYQKEEELAKEYWVSMFSKRQFENDARVRRYLSLTSLPFEILEENDQDFLETQKTIAEMVLKQLRKHNILSSGNLLPAYCVAGSNIDPFSDYLRKALLTAEIYFDCWLTQISQFLEEEIDLLQPEYIIVTGGLKAKNTLPENIAKKVIAITDPAYMFKTKHPYSEYGEGIKTAIEYYKEKNVTS